MRKQKTDRAWKRATFSQQYNKFIYGRKSPHNHRMGCFGQGLGKGACETDGSAFSLRKNPYYFPKEQITELLCEMKESVPLFLLAGDLGISVKVLVTLIRQLSFVEIQSIGKTMYIIFIDDARG